MVKLMVKRLNHGLFQPWVTKMGHIRGCCSGPDAAPGSRADANYWFRGAAQLWLLPDQQPLRLRRGAEPPQKKKVPKESERLAMLDGSMELV